MLQRLLVFAVALLASSVACTSFAQSSYIGGSAGSSAIKLNSSSNDFSTTATVKDESSSGYKAFIGRQLNDWLSVEGGYVDLGKATASYGSTSSVKASVKNSAWFAALKGDVTLGAGFSGFGKLGASYNRSSNAITGACANDGDCTMTKTTLNAMYGVGLEYDVNKTVSFRLEYEDFGTFGKSFGYDSDSNVSSGTGRTKASLWSLGVAVAF